MDGVIPVEKTAVAGRPLLVTVLREKATPVRRKEGK
jgi:hypothetical protein